MKVLVLANHVFSAGGRKASIHFIAEGLKEIGNDVYVVSVGISPLRILKYPSRYHDIRSIASGNWAELDSGIFTTAVISPIHPINFQVPFLDTFFSPALKAMARRLPRQIFEKSGVPDLIVIDSGTAITYYRDLRRRFPQARIVYNAADSLAAISAGKSLAQEEHQILLSSDFVRTPSLELGKTFPPGTNWRHISHGLDMVIFDSALISPFKAGTSNIVSIGNTLHDENAIRVIAEAATHCQVHVFGARKMSSPPSNVVEYGEVGFSEVVPYVKFADVGIAAYRINANSRYLAESSLKMMQYRYCGLSILAPDTVDWRFESVFPYRTDDRLDIARAVDLALKRGRGTPDGTFLNWRDVATEVQGHVHE